MAQLLECGLTELSVSTHSRETPNNGIPEVIDMVVVVCQLFTKTVDF
jgi:hypothetical protein